MEIRPFIAARADGPALRRLHAVYTDHVLEQFPGFPTQPLPSFEASMLRRYAPAQPRRAWTAHEGADTVGLGTVFYPDHADGDLAAWAKIRVMVAPAHRRRGAGTALLRAIVADARERGCTTLANDQTWIGVDGKQTVGERWAHRVGFATVHRLRWQMLHVTDVSAGTWDIPTPAGFRLAHWIDTAPDELVAAFAHARNAMLDAPTGESSYRAPEWTVERVRQTEADWRETGDELRYVVAVHEETGAVAAFTELRLDPTRLDLCWQLDTAVVADFRGRGLGRAIKAAMMRRLLADHPGLQRVVTNNADDNAHMIRVNDQIGYVHYGDIGSFEAPIERVGAALGLSVDIPGPRRETASDATDAGAPEPVG